MHPQRCERLRPTKHLTRKFATLAAASAIVSACAGTPPKPEKIDPPEPIPSNTGEYMSPYTKDGVLAAWVDKAVNAELGAAAGATAGSLAGQAAAEQVPIVGGLVGGWVGEKLGRAAAIEAAGGEDYIRQTSDLSFDELDNMAVWLYATHHDHEHYKQALQSAMSIYPDLEDDYRPAIVDARLASLPPRPNVNLASRLKRPAGIPAK